MDSTLSGFVWPPYEDPFELSTYLYNEILNLNTSLSQKNGIVIWLGSGSPLLGIRFRLFERLVNLVFESDTYRAYDAMRFSQNVN